VPEAEAGDTATQAPVRAGYEASHDNPRWTASDVEIQLGSHLPEAVPDLSQLIESYLWMMGGGDELCPGSTTQLSAVDPELGCTAETGFWYFGVASYVAFEEESLSGQVLSGDFELMDPTGQTLACGGQVGIDEDNDGAARMGALLGTWRWTGADDSLAETVSASMIIEHSGLGAEDLFQSMRIDGGLTTEAGSWVFEDFVLAGECGDAPTGVIHVYDSRRGHWYVLDLEADCSGCGEVRFGDGTSLGRACPGWTGISEHVSNALGVR
jgi:hypothetical protein